MIKIKLPKQDPILFLVGRRFPDYRILMGSLDSVSFSGDESKVLRERFQERRVELKEYESRLKKLSNEDLQSLYKAETEKHKQELIQKLDEKEQLRFYNLPSSNADFEHWSKTAYWTLEEAVALSFGKNPDLVSWNKLKNHTKNFTSPFIEKYRKTRELTRRAKVAKQISDPVWPGAFITWANRNGLSFPQELVGKVESHGHATPDWKDYYDQLKTQHETLEKDHTLVKEKLSQLSSDTTQLDRVLGSNYFQKFLGKIKRAIEEYPSWRNAQKNKVQKTGNLHDWLTKKICLNNREAEMAKQIMSDIFKDLQ